MKPRERVVAALAHREPDRPPFHASFTPEFAARLRRELELGGELPHNPHGGGNPYDLEIALGEDMLVTSVGWANSYYGEGDVYTDEWGVGWRSVEYETPYGKGRYTEIAEHPLADDRAIGSYRAPDPERSELYAAAARTIETFQAEYWIVGAVVTTVFECAWALRGLERLLLDFAVAPDAAEAVLDIPFRYHLAIAERLARLGADMIWLGDDVGAQRSMLVSRECWRRYLKPRLAAIIDAVRRTRPEVKVAYHSDGCIEPIVPELIEIGVDVLNPIQAPCVDPERLKRHYGDRLSFWGSIDEQRTLPFAAPDEVEREVRSRIATLGRRGGLIIGPTHHVQLDTPMENFWAMVRAVTGG
ncbi:MAG: uroporphyrinogen decarboxylase family protein [Planctomycetota bacterium]